MSKMLSVALIGSSFGSALPGMADEGVGTLPPVEITATGDARQVSCMMVLLSISTLVN